MTKAIGNTTSGADNSTPKKTYFGLQKTQEQWTKSSLFTKPELKVEDPYTTPWLYSINDDTMPENYVELPKRKHMIAEEFYEDENGNIDMSQFSEEAIRAKYSDENKYYIHASGNYIWVNERVDNKNGYKYNVICQITYDKNSVKYETIQYNGEKQTSTEYQISNDGKINKVNYSEGYRKIKEYEYNNNYLVSKYNWKTLDREYVAYDNLKKELAVNHIDQQNISKIKIDIYQRLNKDNVIGTFTGFDIITAIQKSKALPEAEKEKMISHITSLLYDANKEIRNSKIENDYYKSEKEYDARFMQHSILVNENNPYKSKWIDFWNIFKYGDNNEFEQVRLQQLLQELPPEALMDFASEVKRFKIQYANITVGEGGHYSYDDTPQGSGKNEIVSIIQDLETLVHELGHAMDFSYNNPEKSNQSKASNSKSFQNAFYEGMYRYKEAGYTRYSTDENYKSVEEQQFDELTLDEQSEKGFRCDSNYCTYNIKEMMAECYTLLILGNCKSKNVILKYFPECLECAKEIIKETRNLPDEERIKP